MRGAAWRQSDPDRSPTSDGRLRELFVRAIQEMRARYVLTYRPAGVKKAGGMS